MNYYVDENIEVYVISYRPVSLLPVMPKILENLLLEEIVTDGNIDETIRVHQFGFRVSHSTV